MLPLSKHYQQPRKMLKTFLLCILILGQSCENQTKMVTKPQESKLDSLFGFWQNIDNPHNFILLAASSTEEGMWGSFPLEPDPLNPEVPDTAQYYKNFCFNGAFRYEQNKFSCWYQDLDKQGIRINGEMSLNENNILKTPVGSFRKLSNEEVEKINPYLE